MFVGPINAHYGTSRPPGMSNTYAPWSRVARELFALLLYPHSSRTYINARGVCIYFPSRPPTERVIYGFGRDGVR